jgi:hypothetical protein
MIAMGAKRKVQREASGRDTRPHGSIRPAAVLPVQAEPCEISWIEDVSSTKSGAF